MAKPAEGTEHPLPSRLQSSARATGLGPHRQIGFIILCPPRVRPHKSERSPVLLVGAIMSVAHTILSTLEESRGRYGQRTPLSRGGGWTVHGPRPALPDTLRSS